MPKNRRRFELAALAVSITILVSIAAGIAACGNDDLFFPAEFAPTATGEPTSTATPDN
jgi:hypothetical protein